MTTEANWRELDERRKGDQCPRHLRQSAYGLVQSRGIAHAIELKPPGMMIETADIGSIPLYNEDVRAQGFPPPVEKLRQQIKEADALLFATPEYNYSIPGVLKNAVDWASRPPDQPFAGKPVAIMGAGMAGTARAQYDLRRCCVFLDMHPLNKPEVLIGVAHTKFDAEGAFTDEVGRGLIRDLLVALDKWTHQLAPRN